MKSNSLKEYYKSCNRLIEEMATKYFPDEGKEWMGEIGGTLYIGDCVLSMEQIVAIMDVLPTKKRLDEAYWYVSGKNPKINFRNYLKYGKIV